MVNTLGAMQLPTGVEALQQRHREILLRLRMLAHDSLQSNMGSVGFESSGHSDPSSPEWVQVDWGHPVWIDQIVLAPILWHVGDSKYTAGGFPEAFRVLAGTKENPEGSVIAVLSGDDTKLPRRAPLVIPCETMASWVRVESIKLSPCPFSALYNLQLSELMVFSGEENVALNQSVTSSSVGPMEADRRSRQALTDGYMPYVMNSPIQGETLAFRAIARSGTAPTLSLDLGESMPINRINIHAFDARNSVPRDVTSDFGIPPNLLIMGANKEDFSDAVTLVERSKKGPYDTGPILLLPFPERQCRYLLFQMNFNDSFDRVVGFAEIEVISRGKNVALGRKVKVKGLHRIGFNRLSRITNGKNSLGQVLPIKQWVNELSQRHDLEFELNEIRAALSTAYATQKKHLALLGWIASLLVGTLVVSTAIMQYRKRRLLATMRERFAADLHDELGANLHSISMLTELAREDLQTPDQLDRSLKDIQRLVATTGEAARYCSTKLTNPKQHNLPEDMRTLTRRILADITWKLDIQGGENLQNFKWTTIDDLFLFYKECLINISRHSRAARVNARLEASKRQITLTVTDDGVGLLDRVPPSVQRRAHLLHGRVSLEKPPQGGTTIQLTLRPPRRLFSFNPKKPTEHP